MNSLNQLIQRIKRDFDTVEETNMTVHHIITYKYKDSDEVFLIKNPKKLYKIDNKMYTVINEDDSVIFVDKEDLKTHTVNKETIDKNPQDFVALHNYRDIFNLCIYLDEDYI